MKKIIYYILVFTLTFNSTYLYANDRRIIYYDKNIKIDNIGNIYILSNNGKIIDDIHFLDTIKEEFQNNSELNIIDVYKEKKSYCYIVR